MHLYCRFRVQRSIDQIGRGSASLRGIPREFKSKLVFPARSVFQKAAAETRGLQTLRPRWWVCQGNCGAGQSGAIEFSKRCPYTTMTDLPSTALEGGAFGLMSFIAGTLKNMNDALTGKRSASACSRRRHWVEERRGRDDSEEPSRTYAGMPLASFRAKVHFAAFAELQRAQGRTR